MREWGCVWFCLLVGAAWGFFSLGLEQVSLLGLLQCTALGAVLGGGFGILVGRRLLEWLIEWWPQKRQDDAAAKEAAKEAAKQAAERGGGESGKDTGCVEVASDAYNREDGARLALHHEKRRRVFDDISPSDYAAIAAAIESSDSPVGIDARKTHIVILHKLIQIEQRLARLEGLHREEGRPDETTGTSASRTPGR